MEVEVFTGIRAPVTDDAVCASRVLRDEVGDVVNYAVRNEPAVFSSLVPRDVAHCEALVAATCSTAGNVHE